MRIDRHLAIKFRKQKRSYNEISRLLGIPKSTMHYWFRGNRWSEEIKKELIEKAKRKAIKQLRLMAKANKERYEKGRRQWRKDAVKEFPLMKRKLLFLAGIMLYWGEGDKKPANGLVRVGNTDPELIKTFYFFLKNILKVPIEKIKIRLTLYPDLKESTYKKFWSKVLNIPLNHFEKTVFIQGRHLTRRLSYGICTIEVRSQELKEKIFTWLKLYQNKFSEKYAGVV